MKKLFSFVVLLLFVSCVVASEIREHSPINEIKVDLSSYVGKKVPLGTIEAAFVSVATIIETGMSYVKVSFDKQGGILFVRDERYTGFDHTKKSYITFREGGYTGEKKGYDNEPYIISAADLIAGEEGGVYLLGDCRITLDPGEHVWYRFSINRDSYSFFDGTEFEFVCTGKHGPISGVTLGGKMEFSYQFDTVYGSKFHFDDFIFSELDLKKSSIIRKNYLEDGTTYYTVFNSEVTHEGVVLETSRPLDIWFDGKEHESSNPYVSFSSDRLVLHSSEDADGSLRARFLPGNPYFDVAIKVKKETGFVVHDQLVFGLSQGSTVIVDTIKKELVPQVRVRLSEKVKDGFSIANGRSHYYLNSIKDKVSLLKDTSINTPGAGSVPFSFVVVDVKDALIYPRKFHFDNFNDLYIIPPIKYISGEGVATSESGLKGRYDEHVRFQSSFSPESVIARNSIPVLQLGGESEGIKPRAGCRDNDPLNSRGTFIREDFPHEITKRLDDVLATGPVGACHTVDSIVVLPEKEFNAAYVRGGGSQPLEKVAGFQSITDEGYRMIFLREEYHDSTIIVHELVHTWQTMLERRVTYPLFVVGWRNLGSPPPILYTDYSDQSPESLSPAQLLQKQQHLRYGFVSDYASTQFREDHSEFFAYQNVHSDWFLQFISSPHFDVYTKKFVYAHMMAKKLDVLPVLSDEQFFSVCFQSPRCISYYHGSDALTSVKV